MNNQPKVASKAANAASQHGTQTEKQDTSPFQNIRSAFLGFSSTISKAISEGYDQLRKGATEPEPKSVIKSTIPSHIGESNITSSLPTAVIASNLSTQATQAASNIAQSIASVYSKAASQYIKTKASIYKKKVVNLMHDGAFVNPTVPPANPNEKIYDCCAFVIHCKAHNKVAVSKSQTGVIWLPFNATQNKCSWNEAAIDGVPYILAAASFAKQDYIRSNPPISYMQILEIFRLQLPQTQKFITRVTFYIALKPDESEKFVCCQNTATIVWYDINYIGNGVMENIWGPEVVEFCRMSTVVQAESSLPQKLVEYGLNKVFHYVSRESAETLEESLVKSMKITENDVERVYLDFLDHCYPSIYMTVDSFKQYIIRHGFEMQDSRLKRLFNAFNYRNNGFLSFQELLLGFVCIERDTPHNEVRIKFIFRFYDTKKKSLLSEDDIKRIIKDITVDKKGKPIPIPEPELQEQAKNAMALMHARVVQNKYCVSYTGFFSAIAQHKFRGTSILCRSKKYIFATISKRMTDKTIQSNKEIVKGQFTDVVTKKFGGKCRFSSSFVSLCFCSVTCQNCIKTIYRLSSNIGLINQNGMYENYQPVELHGESAHSLGMITDLKTLELESTPAILMRLVRTFNQNKSNGIMTNGTEREHLFQILRLLEKDLEPILKAEPRCKSIRSPCFVIGDIHGNLEDLISLEQTTWKKFPITGGVHYLFLGDYVDRGKWGLECAIYLMAMKLMNPLSVTLLRGNHEVREIQIKYTYKRECILKYDERIGNKVFELTNDLFDKMPICAIVDNTVFCCHGGIPHEVTKIEDINKSTPNDLSSPEDCSLAWEILWSDPVAPEVYKDILEQQSLNELRSRGIKDGFAKNRRRGTAFFFTDIALNNFFKENNLTYIIRAHEVPRIGFMFLFDLRCTTVFSCSHYSGFDNEAAVILIGDGRLRPIRIDTSANGSAFDPSDCK